MCYLGNEWKEVMEYDFLRHFLNPLKKIDNLFSSLNLCFRPCQDFLDSHSCVINHSKKESYWPCYKSLEVQAIQYEPINKILWPQQTTLTPQVLYFLFNGIVIADSVTLSKTLIIWLQLFFYDSITKYKLKNNEQQKQ